MPVNTAIGEAACEIRDSHYTVSPAFAALAALGRPEEIEYIVRCCFAAFESVTKGKSPRVLDLAACSSMLEACSDIPSELLGWAEPGKGERLVWRQKALTVNDLVVMANHCVKWGIMGDPRRTMSKAKRKKAAGLFDPQQFVAILIDEFHMDRATAWGTTMTEFQRLCEARERKNWGDRPEPPTKESAEQSFKWARDVIERAKTHGVKRERGKKRRARG